ncbi:MAG: biotin synthase BioB [Deltaproteobacteria bacterium]|nr:biotin synthase BioB [Deltaproteobacteria bacterium]
MEDDFEYIRRAMNTVLGGNAITASEAKTLLDMQDPPAIQYLMACANRIRETFLGKVIEFCAIVNAKSGKCSENCSFCAQSAHHRTGVNVYPMMSSDSMVEAARKARDQGATRFSIVTSGKGVLKDRDLDTILETVDEIVRGEGIDCCASLGLVDREDVRALKQAGLTRYHHNLETSRSHFPNICTTHGFEERVQVLRICREEGLEVCSGGIIGLGETREQRLELAYTLIDCGVHSVPINILNAIPGTPLEKEPPLSPLEVLKTISVYRFLMPGTEIRTCGGRENALRGLQPLMFMAGCTGTMIGNYLTTEGRLPADDVRDVLDLGLYLRKPERDGK